MAITKIHAVKVRLGDAINYIENPDKTDGQELISGYNTAPQTAVLDFSVTAAMARKARNASAKKQGNLAYHLIQSFSPDDDVTPERAHELGRKLAMEFTDGKFEFVVATHINKDSIHNSHLQTHIAAHTDHQPRPAKRWCRQPRAAANRLVHRIEQRHCSNRCPPAVPQSGYTGSSRSALQEQRPCRWDRCPA